MSIIIPLRLQRLRSMSDAAKRAYAGDPRCTVGADSMAEILALAALAGGWRNATARSYMEEKARSYMKERDLAYRWRPVLGR